MGPTLHHGLISILLYGCVHVSIVARVLNVNDNENKKALRSFITIAINWSMATDTLKTIIERTRKIYFGHGVMIQLFQINVLVIGFPCDGSNQQRH